MQPSSSTLFAPLPLTSSERIRQHQLEAIIGAAPPPLFQPTPANEALLLTFGVDRRFLLRAVAGEAHDLYRALGPEGIVLDGSYGHKRRAWRNERVSAFLHLSLTAQ